jgi:ABC-type transporter Mla subunit MlaD
MHAIDSSRELSKTGSGSSFDIRQLSKTADVAKRAADAATLSTESTTVAKHLKDIDDAIAQMSGFAANTSSSLSGLHLNVKTSLDQLKLARDETAALAQRLKNVATNVTQ